uniref:Uncharacterized protein n=1 Tax=Parascaris univalens TaxID=6257 RepID=A0A915ALM2_PARUN
MCRGLWSSRSCGARSRSRRRPRSPVLRKRRGGSRFRLPDTSSETERPLTRSRPVTRRLGRKRSALRRRASRPRSSSTISVSVRTSYSSSASSPRRRRSRPRNLRPRPRKSYRSRPRRTQRSRRLSRRTRR